MAYKGALARPLLCPESALAGLSADKLRAFHARNFTPPRMVLAAAGLSHAQLKQMADELLGGLPSAPASPAPASTYVGGDFRCAPHLAGCFSAGCCVLRLLSDSAGASIQIFHSRLQRFAAQTARGHSLDMALLRCMLLASLLKLHDCKARPPAAQAVLGVGHDAHHAGL